MNSELKKAKIIEGNSKVHDYLTSATAEVFHQACVRKDPGAKYIQLAYDKKVPQSIEEYTKLGNELFSLCSGEVQASDGEIRFAIREIIPTNINYITNESDSEDIVVDGPAFQMYIFASLEEGLADNIFSITKQDVLSKSAEEEQEVVNQIFDNLHFAMSECEVKRAIFPLLNSLD